MYAEDLVCLLLSKELDEALGIQVGLRSRVCSEREFSDIVLNTGGLQVLLCLAYPSDLGVCIDNGRDGVVVDMTVSMFNVFDGSNALTVP